MENERRSDGEQGGGDRVDWMFDESSIYHEGDFEDDAIMDWQPVQLLQAVSVIKGGVMENKFILCFMFN